jgi:tRNA-Thr(GGU) m(6)t(6)A37 methyltransferase TsaA
MPENIQNMKIRFRPIGIIRSPFQDVKGMPIQSSGMTDAQGKVFVDTTFEEGLTDIVGFSHIILIYLFHRSEGYQLTVKPFLDDVYHGVFATRAPRRPNPIGLSIVELIKREKNVLHIRGVDVLDNTPLLDIKPYVPAFDIVQVSSVGWLKGKETNARMKKADARFKVHPE